MTLWIISFVSCVFCGVIALSTKPGVTKGQYVVMWVIALINIAGSMLSK